LDFGEDLAAVRVFGEDAIEIFSDIDDHLVRLSVGTGGEQSGVAGAAWGTGSV
jgi:hypothetical protein